MCKEDIREGRKKYTTYRQVDVPAAAAFPLLPVAHDRTHITIATTNAGLRLVPDTLDPVTGGCFFIDSTKPPLDFDVETHGDVVTKAWRGAGNAGTSSVLVIETFWKDN